MIKIKNLSKTYKYHFKQIKAVQNINLEIKKGETFGFLGPNGAGKTTTIKLILGLLKADTGSITIQTRQEDRDTGPDLIVQSFAIIEVIDNGCGIDEDDKEKVFDDFYSSKAIDKGSGMGLAIVLRLIETYNGFIEIESVKGKGTTVRIGFPIRIPN